MDRKGTKMFNSLLRGADVVSKCQAMNRRIRTELKTMLSRPLSLWACLYRQLYLMNYDVERVRYQSVSLVLVIVKNFLKRPGVVHTTRTKPWPTRSPTSDNNSPIMKRRRTNDAPKCFSNLGNCSGLSKEATVGTRAVFR